MGFLSALWWFDAFSWWFIDDDDEDTNNVHVQEIGKNKEKDEDAYDVAGPFSRICVYGFLSDLWWFVAFFYISKIFFMVYDNLFWDHFRP